MRIVKVIGLVFVFLSLAAHTAQAVSPPAGNGTITHARGKERPVGCRLFADAAGASVWRGIFKGRRYADGSRRRVGGTFCFANAEECRQWLYDMNSINDGPIRSNQCNELR